MNINNWLCKHFDTDKKGYVTLGDILKPIILVILRIAVLIGLVIYPIYKFVSIGAFWSNPPITDIGIEAWGGTLVLLILATIVVIIILSIGALIEYVLEIKIAKCPLKQNKGD